MKQRLGRLLRRARGRLTQAEAAERCAVTTTRLSDFEHGRRIPNLETFSRLIVGLGIDANEALRAVFARRKER